MGAEDRLDYAGRLVELSTQLEQAFPEYRCLRCHSERFVLRLIVDPSSDGSETTVETLETTCKRCGMIELHLVKALTDGIVTKQLPRRADD